MAQLRLPCQNGLLFKQKNHDMNKTPKDAWADIITLMKGLTNHHVHPNIMHIKLSSGALASPNEENASIFGPHLAKVCNAKIPVNWAYTRHMIKRRKIWSLNDPILWWELKQEINSLIYNKVAGLNCFTPIQQKLLRTTTLLNFSNSATPSLPTIKTTKSGTKVKYSQYRKPEKTLLTRTAEGGMFDGHGCRDF